MNKFAKNKYIKLEKAGYVLGAYNAYKIYDDYEKGGEKNTAWYTIDELSNLYSTAGGLYGAAWGVGWEGGRIITNTNAYQEVKFNFWYNRLENQIGPPTEKNEVIWEDFYQNY